jgi:DNA-directed RNA polymerase subunit M/transcription elongation factor TFIIS
MNFCDKCHNLLYPYEENNELFLRCSCGFKKKHTDKVVFSISYKKNNDVKDTTSNKYIIYDNTLPRTTKKKCPNDDCESNRDETKREVVFYPTKKTMELVYVCCSCNTEWKYT